MTEYLIKEWTMRILAMLFVGVLFVTGCSALQSTERLPALSHSLVEGDDVVLPGVKAAVPEKEPSFLEALRTACRRDGSFMMMWEGKEEIYDCSPRQ